MGDVLGLVVAVRTHARTEQLAVAVSTNGHHNDDLSCMTMCVCVCVCVLRSFYTYGRSAIKGAHKECTPVAVPIQLKHCAETQPGTEISCTHK